MSVSALLKFLQLGFRPQPHVKTREECEQSYGKDWGILICQQRMTDYHQAQLEGWYDGSIATDGLIPALATTSDNVAPVATSGVAASSPAGDASPVDGDAGVTHCNTDEFPSKLNDRLEALQAARVLAELPATPTATVVVHNTCTDLIVYQPPIDWVTLARSLNQQASAPAEIACPTTGSRGSAQEIWAALTAVWDRVYLNLAGAAQFGAAHLNPPDTEPDTFEGPQYPTEEVGSASLYINAAAVAMELRAKFGVPTKTPANYELGGRVSRELLRDNCRCSRADVWYLSQCAVQMWWQPTLVDLVHRTKPEGFC
jgi:hypothetical protein